MAWPKELSFDADHGTLSFDLGSNRRVNPVIESTMRKLLLGFVIAAVTATTVPGFSQEAPSAHNRRPIRHHRHHHYRDHVAPVHPQKSAGGDRNRRRAWTA